MAFGCDSNSGRIIGNVRVLAPTNNSSSAQTRQVIAKVKAVADGLAAKVDSIGTSSEKIHEEYAVKFDGKDYPYYRTVLPHIGSTDANFVVSAKKSNNYTYEITVKQQNRVDQVQRHVVSKDGRTQSVAITGTYGDHTFSDTIVLEKQ